MQCVASFSFLRCVALPRVGVRRAVRVVQHNGLRDVRRGLLPQFHARGRVLGVHGRQLRHVLWICIEQLPFVPAYLWVFIHGQHLHAMHDGLDGLGVPHMRGGSQRQCLR